MARPDPIQYAERLYSAIRAANFSPISFLAFGNAIKDGLSMRNMPRIAAEPFMRVVGEMLDLEEELARAQITDGSLEVEAGDAVRSVATASVASSVNDKCEPIVALEAQAEDLPTGSPKRRRSKR